MIKTNNKSLIKQIYMLTYMFLVCFIIVTIIIFFKFCSYYKNMVIENTNINMERYVFNFEKEFYRLERTMQMFFSSESLLNDVKLSFQNSSDFHTQYLNKIKIDKYINDLLLQVDYIEGIALIDNSGEIKYARNLSQKSIEEINNERKTDYYQSNAYTYSISNINDNTIYLSGKIFKTTLYEWGVIGEFVLKINMRDFSNIYFDLFTEKNAFVLFSKNLKNKIGGNSFDDGDINEVLSNNNDKINIVNIDGQYMYMFMINDTSNRFGYMQLVSLYDIYKENFNIIYVLGIIIVAVILAIMIFVLRYTKNIILPIQNLNTALSNIESKNFDFSNIEKIPNGSKNEIHILQNRFYDMFDRLNDYIYDNYVYQAQLKEMHIKQLNAQINPHFLYNTLDVLYWTALGKDQEEIADLIKNLGDLFRFATDIKDDIIPLSKELDILKAYIKIQSKRFSDRLDIKIEIDDEFFNVLIPKFSLQPLLENAINATTEKELGCAEIRIRAKVCDDMLKIFVCDNGTGIEDGIFEKILNGTYQSKSGGFALVNINQRLKYLFGEKSGVYKEKEDKMFIVGFSVPINFE